MSDNMTAYAYLITIEFDRQGGHESGRMWITEPFKMTHVGTHRISAGSPELDVIEEIITKTEKMAWDRYQATHDYLREQFPPYNPFVERGTVLAFHLGLNWI